MIDEQDEVLPDGKRSFHQFMGIKSRKKTILKALLLSTWKYIRYNIDLESSLANPECPLLMFYENYLFYFFIHFLYCGESDTHQFFCQNPRFQRRQNHWPFLNGKSKELPRSYQTREDRFTRKNYEENV